MVTQQEEYTVECENVPNPEELRTPTMLPCRASYSAASTAELVRADVTRLVQPCDMQLLRLPQVEIMAGQTTTVEREEGLTGGRGKCWSQ
jgi:hypothetical protein